MSVSESPLAFATRLICARAKAGEICGSRPEPEVVTASAGTGVAIPAAFSRSRSAATRSLSFAEVVPRFEPEDAAALWASGPVAEGNVGGGTGMVCYGFKGGIGTASRRVSEEAGGFTVGALVQANFGRRERLRIDGVPVGEAIPASEVPRPGMAPLSPGSGSIIAILATDGFEQSELEKPRAAFDAEGAETKVVSPVSKPKGWSGKDWGKAVAADVALSDARADDFDALLLPGGVYNPDALRIIPEAVAFVKAFFDAGKPVAAICHGPWTVLEAGAARGRRMTSWPSLEADLKNAGADWVDQEVVVDDGLVTSRKPDDLPAFCAKMVEAFAEGRRDAA